MAALIGTIARRLRENVSDIAVAASQLAKGRLCSHHQQWKVDGASNQPPSLLLCFGMLH